jgi:hypothetical protein
MPAVARIACFALVVRALRACAGIVPGNLRLTGRRDFPPDLLAVAAAAEVVHGPPGLAERRGEPPQLACHATRRAGPVLRRLPLRVAGLDRGQQFRRAALEAVRDDGLDPAGEGITRETLGGAVTAACCA